MALGPMRGIRLLFVVVFFVLGPVQLAMALLSAWSTQRFLQRNPAAQAEVVQLKPVIFQTHPGRPSYAAVFTFTAEDGRSYTVRSETASRPPAYKIGQKLTVHYEKDHPERARIDSFLELWAVALFHGVVGVFFTGLMLIAMFVRVGTPRTYTLPNAGTGPAS